LIPCIALIRKERRLLQVNRKTYVLDTCVLIDDPDIFYKLGKSQIVIPSAVIKELDGLKRSWDPDRAKPARQVTRILDRLSRRQDIKLGAITSAGSIVRIYSSHAVIDDLASGADNRIVGTAIQLKQDTVDYVILVTHDGNMRNIARSYGVAAESYPLSPSTLINKSKRAA
jgi:PhoH-like ATPase